LPVVVQAIQLVAVMMPVAAVAVLVDCVAQSQKAVVLRELLNLNLL
jgi:hypothetical protein